MSNLVNFIKINEENDTVSGNIASLTYDLDITGERIHSENPKAPAYRLYGQTPRGRRIEIGSIWENDNSKGGKYFSLTVNTGHGKLIANLGRYPGQDDESLFAVIARD